MGKNCLGGNVYDRVRIFRTYLRPGQEHAYEDFHRSIPGKLDTAMRAAGIVEWRIYRDGTVLVHEVLALDPDHAFESLDATSVNRQWQEQVAPFLDVARVEENDDARDGTAKHLVWDFAWPTR